jgi:hypothetical protein
MKCPWDITDNDRRLLIGAGLSEEICNCGLRMIPIGKTLCGLCEKRKTQTPTPKVDEREIDRLIDDHLLHIGPEAEKQETQWANEEERAKYGSKLDTKAFRTF